MSLHKASLRYCEQNLILFIEHLIGYKNVYVYKRKYSLIRYTSTFRKILLCLDHTYKSIITIKISKNVNRVLNFSLIK